MLKDLAKIYSIFGSRFKSALVDLLVVAVISSLIAIIVVYIIYNNLISVDLDSLIEISVYSVGINKIFVSDILQSYQGFILEKVANRGFSLQSETLFISKKILLWGYIYNILFVITLCLYKDKMRLFLLHSFLRYIVMIIIGKLTYTLGFVTVIFRKDKQSLHDIIAKTYVIYK